MNSKLLIAAVACLGLAACQQQEGKKAEKKAEHAETAEHAAPAPASHEAEHSATPAEHGTDRAPEHAAPTTPPAPGASYYDNNQNLAEQANPAIDSQETTAQMEGQTLSVSQNTEEAPAAH